METTAQTEVAYDGDALRDGTMDVRDLAPALLAIGSLCERANLLLNGDRATVAVGVRPTEKGSFKFIIDLWQSLPEPVREILVVHKASEANDILKLLGLLFTPATATVVAVWKFLQNRKPTREVRLPDGFTRIEINNTFIDVQSEVAILASDPVIKNEWKKTLGPLRHPGIDSFEIREGRKRLSTIQKEDLEVFQDDEIPAAIPERTTLSDVTSETPLVLVKPAFRDNLKWEVARDSVSGSFSAAMKDEKFLERARRRQEKFGIGDVLITQLRTITYFTGEGALRTEYEIIEVTRIVEPPTQNLLFNPGE